MSTFLSHYSKKKINLGIHYEQWTAVNMNNFKVLKEKINGQIFT